MHIAYDFISGFHSFAVTPIGSMQYDFSQFDEFSLVLIVILETFKFVYNIFEQFFFFLSFVKELFSVRIEWKTVSLRDIAAEAAKAKQKKTKKLWNDMKWSLAHEENEWKIQKKKKRRNKR